MDQVLAVEESLYKKWSFEIIWSLWKVFFQKFYLFQPAFTCSKLTIETLELGLEYVQS